MRSHHPEWIGAVLLAAVLLAGCGGSSGGGVAAQANVTISSGKQYQRIAGFGVSEGFGQAKALMSAPVSVQQQVLSLLYSPARGAGLTILRNEISADAGYTIEPRAPGSPGGKPSYLTLADVGQDQGQLWFAKQIKAGYGVSDVFADAWSAPAFMKTNDSAINGGTLCGSPGASCKSGDWRQAYASYLVQYAEDYAAAGVPLSYVGPENETTIAPPQDSMIMSPAQTANFMRILGAALARSGLSTRAECCASISWNYAQQFAAAIKTDKAADTATALFTSHGYYVPPGSPLKGWSKPVWQTEWAPFSSQQPWDPAWDDGSPSSGFTWARNIYTGLTAANLGAFLYLWGANTSTTTITGPNTGLVDVQGNTVATSGRLWAFASYSRFIRPGAVRIASSTSDAGLDVTAVRNSDGSIAVIVLNSAHSRQVAAFSLRGLGGAHVTPYLTDTSHQLSAQPPIAVRNSAFTATLPPRSLVTYDIRSLSSPPAVT
jgi:O-glycosyl hydrolase